MIKVIEKYKSSSSIQILKNVPHNDYLSLLRTCSVLVGNSSSGIIEAPSFGIPVVNIGTRQSGRQRGCNIIDVGYTKKEIISAITYALTNNEFINQVHLCNNPYGDGKTGERIIKILSKITLNNILLQKRMTY